MISLHVNLQAANFQRCECASDSSKEPEPVPSMSDVSETAAGPLSPIADDPSALPSPTSSPSSGRQLFLPVYSMPAPVYQLLYSQLSSVAQSCLTLCNPMDGSTPGLPVHHQLLGFTQTHVHW